VRFALLSPKLRCGMVERPVMSRTKFSQFAWGLLIYNIAVVLWGALVRATGSGNGCGDHWPACGPGLIPNPQHAATWIELTHRVTVGAGIFLVIALCVLAYRLFPKGSPVRLYATLAVVFTFTEALIGAGLVVFKLVAHDESLYRAVAMSAHLVNTLVLLGMFNLTAWWSGDEPKLDLKRQGAVGWALLFSLVLMVFLAVTGAISALGDTLHPASSLAAGLEQDFAPRAGFLLSHRPWHPYTAISVGLYIILIAGITEKLRPSPMTRQMARWVVSLLLAQVSMGFLNLVLLAPIWMQIAHLLLGIQLWLSIVMLTVSALSEGVPKVELMTAEHITGRPDSLVPVGRATWKDYVALTKPRVISLLLFTTMTAMFMAARHWPGLALFLATSVGLYMAAGAANAINMVLERDLDLRMERTASRPTVTQSVPPATALWFAFGLEAGSFVLLWSVANLLAAILAFAGLVVYVIVYTILLKRRTWSNIVIGGAAGAFPPLVGWAAVTGNLSPLAWCLFALIFVWTPVHFWALALLIKDDYAKAGVPMLPVVRGERHTVLQIAMYTVATVVMSILPLLLPGQEDHAGVGGIYIVAAVLLNLLLLGRSFQLYQHTDRPRASKLFHYSMLYLALLFLALAVDRVVGVGGGVGHGMRIYL